MRRDVHIAPLAVFRVLFGLAMTISTIRFISLGWIDKQYVEPVMHFTYYGFEWVKALPALGMYALFGVLLLSGIGIMIGAWYRISAPLFFLVFTYIELIDKTYYLNHYYFVSIVALLLAVVPAHRYFSIDVLRNPGSQRTTVPFWVIGIFQAQLGIVYFYAGLAKINEDWLLHAMPLRIWLPAQDNMPVIGPLLRQTWAAYVFSWAGMLYDVFIPFLLLIRRTRWLAYAAVVAFHSLTGYFFQIGVFPLVMILCTLIFFSESFHIKLIRRVREAFRLRATESLSASWQPAVGSRNLYAAFLLIYFTIQIALPWRYLLYPGNMFWTEEGYRFGWRVMLMEKAGTATFFVRNPETGKEGVVVNSEFLNAHQEKQMAMQPDMVLEYASFLASYYQKQGMKTPEVRAEVWVTLNGRRSRLLVDPKVNLAARQENLFPKDWILPLNNMVMQPEWVAEAENNGVDED
ncbi:HTTM domain-containing protein [Roseivirga sp. BDSF3-8]|uniref:HTTM domain-containing protein n=1 Tax=Roseivirga sp. BDSF3-8 TaxID=3241598 RepID=UPI003531889A